MNTTPAKGRPRGPVQPARRAADLVPPAQYNRMGAPVWRPASAPAGRPGADDHKRFESRGFRC